MARLGPRKLTAEQVLQAREDHAHGTGAAELARRYGVHRVTMRAILLGYSYCDVGGPIAPLGGRVIVSNENARLMRTYRASGSKIKDLAWLFETTTSNVHLIVTGQTHKEAGGPIQEIAKDTPESVIREIRLLRAIGYSYAELSEEFGKTPVALRSICCGKSYPYAGGPLVPKRGKNVLVRS